MENYLNKMVKYIKEYPVKLSTNVTAGGDGRVDSAKNEDEVITHLREVPEFDRVMFTPPPRAFYDFSISENGEPLYVNIKVSDLSNRATDNCSSKEGLAYALTGRADLPTHFADFHEVIRSNLKSGYDYYFLVVNKKNPSEAYWTSLKRIKTLVPNGNNLPFQCDWALNKEFSNRTEEEATRYLLEVYLSSWEKRIEDFPSGIKELLDSGKPLIK